MVNKRYNDNRIVLIMACIVILVLSILIVKNVKSMNNINDEISNEHSVYMTNKAELDEFQALLLLKPELEKAHSILVTQIPQEAQEYDIINYVNGVALENEANLFDIRFNSKEDSTGESGGSGDIKEMPVTLILKGPYVSLAEFVHDLSSGRRLFRIDKIQLQRDGDLEGNINASVTANVFYK
jgi:Tfp pilus assembly protein PilO